MAISKVNKQDRILNFISDLDSHIEKKQPFSFGPKMAEHKTGWSDGGKALKTVLQFKLKYVKHVKSQIYQWTDEYKKISLEVAIRKIIYEIDKHEPTKRADENEIKTPDIIDYKKPVHIATPIFDDLEKFVLKAIIQEQIDTCEAHSSKSLVLSNILGKL